MAVLNREAALAIAGKLKAEIVTRKKAHDLALIFHRGRVVAKFGIRRGRKDLGHDHIMSDIFLSARDARLLASCEISQEDWIVRMTEKGHLPDDDD